MDEPTQKALLWSLLTVVPVYIGVCAVIGAKKKALGTWLLYGAAGAVVLVFPSVAVLKGMFVESLTFSGQVAEASAWDKTWSQPPPSATEIDFYEDPSRQYFSCRVDRDSFEAWCSQNGLAKAGKQEWAQIDQTFVTRFKNRGVDLTERKLHYHSGSTLALFYPKAGLMYVQMGTP